MTKKVILVIVEGQTEQEVFNDYLEERFSNADVRIAVQYGDVLSAWNRKKEPLKKRIGQVIKEYLAKYKLLARDLLTIVHITDTDGCFVDAMHVIIDQEKTSGHMYTDEAIYVVNEKKKNDIENRNELKARHIRTLAKDPLFKVNSVSVPYQLFYFSINLDHVLWDERNAKREMKLEKAETFLENLTEPLEQFFKTCSSINFTLPYEEKYETSWNQLMMEENSLQRDTNVSLLFEWVDQLS
ncbi:hypothetical protein [Solibacillus sp. CAU 1738]|uniref:hypothetical protein n=1 Tax=Solibacillus sp. CAU 1738 TaxID=3140363 RepID=UPI003260207C